MDNLFSAPNAYYDRFTQGLLVAGLLGLIFLAYELNNSASVRICGKKEKYARMAGNIFAIKFKTTIPTDLKIWRSVSVDEFVYLRIVGHEFPSHRISPATYSSCLLYTSDAADE